ncbi:BCCIP -like protein [Caligus rogercresseyi]|uniref:BCCIP -like protein n=1 Tax=Caligus rogercresseyi TaxID=217165 RepID=A0A7T8QX65_CALRO|nr:BCCIP -like protein [Caligus rogercresseyi]
MSRMPLKKAHLALETPENTESSSSSEDEEDEMLDEEDRGELQVEFEARTAEDCDYHGITRLLKQTFKGDEIPLDGLANYIIAQKTVGSVITQSNSGGADEDDEDEFDDLQNEVFGLISLCAYRIRVRLHPRLHPSTFAPFSLQHPRPHSPPSSPGTIQE